MKDPEWVSIYDHNPVAYCDLLFIKTEKEVFIGWYSERLNAFCRLGQYEGVDATHLAYTKKPKQKEIPC